MSEVTLECELLQKDELEVLKAIYPDYTSIDPSKSAIELEVPVEFSAPQEVVIFSQPNTSYQDGNATPEGSQTVSIAALPPLLLHLILPSRYPLDVPPEIISFRTSQYWLPRLSHLQAILLGMWKPGDAVLYNWVEFIRTGAFFESLEMIDKDIIRIPNPVPQFLAQLLTSYDQAMISNAFRLSTYPCSVCLTEYKGTKCIQLSCEHIFCRSCLEDFWGLCISEGDVGRVGCPDPACVKAGREATEDEVSRIATEEQMARWKWLREKRAFEQDPGTISCPIPCCQALVPSPPSNGEDSAWNRLRQCPKCGFSFCSFCKRSWHGPLTSCPISAIETLIIEYRALPEGSSQRSDIERRVGRSMFSKLLAKYEEELLNMKWLEASTMACPKCNVRVEKSLGCNHMTCAKCSQHFCYCCGAKLQASNPYKHFSTPGLTCHNRLFDLQQDDDEWEPMALDLA